jgi:hypothetical protein
MTEEHVAVSWDNVLECGGTLLRRSLRFDLLDEDGFAGCSTSACATGSDLNHRTAIRIELSLQQVSP